jgi:hypothetical protein
MKKLLCLFFSVFVIAACSPMKPTPAGQWDYQVSETPEGDVVGTLTITGPTADPKSFAVMMKANGSELAMDKFSFDAETNKIAGEFIYSGMKVTVDAIQHESGDEITGAMWVSGLDFPFKATRKK